MSTVRFCALPESPETLMSPERARGNKQLTRDRASNLNH